jgi:hypothetical protein
MSENYACLHVKCLIFFSSISKNKFGRQILMKMHNEEFQGNPSSGTQLFHACGQKDGQIERNE